MYNPMKKIFLISLLLLVCCAFSHAGDPIRVACVGDSITYGFGIENREKQSYPAQLQRILGEECIVGNFGKNGATALKKGHAPYWKAPQFKQALKFRPDIVIIILGTNDSRPENWPKLKEDYVGDYIDLVHRFQNLESSPTVFICTSAPIYPGTAVERKGFSDTIVSEEVLPKVRAVAKETGVKVIDMNAALRNAALFDDGVHPNAKGAEIIAETVAAVINTKYKIEEVF